MIYELRIVARKGYDDSVTLIEHIKAKGIAEARSKGQKLANENKGILKAVTAKPEYMGLFDLIEDDE